jgi:hypothetical protein
MIVELICYITEGRGFESEEGRVIFFFDLPNSSSRIVTLKLTRPLTEMHFMNVPGGKARPVVNAYNVTTVYESAVYKPWNVRLVTTLRASTAC